jgi:hypothetical protein
MRNPPKLSPTELDIQQSIDEYYAIKNQLEDPSIETKERRELEGDSFRILGELTKFEKLRDRERVSTNRMGVLYAEKLHFYNKLVEAINKTLDPEDTKFTPKKVPTILKPFLALKQNTVSKIGNTFVVVATACTALLLGRGIEAIAVAATPNSVGMLDLMFSSAELAIASAVVGTVGTISAGLATACYQSFVRVDKDIMKLLDRTISSENTIEAIGDVCRSNPTIVNLMSDDVIEKLTSKSNYLSKERWRKVLDEKNPSNYSSRKSSHAQDHDLTLSREGDYYYELQEPEDSSLRSGSGGYEMEYPEQDSLHEDSYDLVQPNLPSDADSLPKASPTKSSRSQALRSSDPHKLP